MAIVKGYLRPQFTINKQWLISGIVIGTLFSFVMYLFFYYYFELSRILTNPFNPENYGERALVELTTKEHFLYNIFYGSIAAIIGLYIIITFTVQNSIENLNRKGILKQRAILNEGRFIIWNFISIFFRMSSLIGIWFLTLPIQFDIDFLKDHYLLLILIPIAMFLNIWPIILKTVGKSGYKWLLYSLLYVVTLTFVYGNINFINSQEIDQQINRSNKILTYSIDVPSTHSFQVIDFTYFSINLYVAKDPSGQDQPSLYIDGSDSKVDYVEIKNAVELKMYRYNYGDENIIIPNLIIDQSIKLEAINDLKKELRKSSVRTIQYSTTVKNSKYPPIHPQFKFVGLRYNLEPLYHTSFPDLLDSIENLNVGKYILKLPESSLYRIHEIKNSKFIKIAVTPENAFLNGKPIADEELQVIFYKFIKAHSPNYSIVFDPDEKITFGRYIHYLDMMYSTVDKLRNEMSIGIFGKTYEEPSLYSLTDHRKHTDPIIIKFPRNIIELSDEEKRLLEVIKKSGYVRD